MVEGLQAPPIPASRHRTSHICGKDSDSIGRSLVRSAALARIAFTCICRVLSEACLCCVHLAPAIRARLGASAVSEYVRNTVERLQGVGLAALYMHNPSRDSQRRGFNGASGNDDRCPIRAC